MSLSRYRHRDPLPLPPPPAALLPGLPFPTAGIAPERSVGAICGSTSDFDFLYQQIVAAGAAALPKAGGALTGTLAINTTPGNNLTLDGRYALSTDNTGSPPHTATGPNLYLTDLIAGKQRVKFNSLGEAAFTISDPSLVNDGVSHAVQLWGMCGNGTAAPGFGTGLQIFLSDAAGVGQEAGNLQCWLENGAAGSISTAIALLNRVSGVGQMVLYCDALGEVRLAAATGYLTVPHAVTATANYGLVNTGEAGFAGGGGTAFAGSIAGTHYAANAAAGFAGDFLSFQLAGVPLYKVASTGQQTMWARDANTNGPSSALIVSHKLSAGSPAVGFGSGVQLWGLDSGGAALQIADVVAEELALTPGAVSAAVLFRTLIAGALTEGARVHSTGDFISAFKVLATGGVGVGNSAAATTPGSVVRKFQVFDQNGTSLGYVPIYSSIT